MFSTSSMKTANLAKDRVPVCIEWRDKFYIVSALEISQGAYRGSTLQILKLQGRTR